LDSKKAIGIDSITKEDYGKKLKENPLLLLTRIRKGQYQAKSARITKIPKKD
ncbi:reverse transcriptase domain protein, partial [Orientia tsutsugamushi str. Karp]